MAKRSKIKKVAGDGVSWKADWIWGVILFAAVLLVYQPVWYCGYVWDDDMHVTGNPYVIGPLGLKEIWTTGVWAPFPLTITAFWMEHAWWGVAPRPYHLVNVLEQAGCAVLLWRVLQALQVPGAWLGAALWALHPMQVESVAWISEMKSTQSGLFYLGTILFFLRWLQKRDEWCYSLALVCFALALASKSSTLVLPVVLVLCAWWMERRWPWRYAGRLAPFFLMALVSAAITLWPQSPASNLGADPGETRSWLERIVTSGDVIWFYLGKLLWPHPLLAIYPRWQIDAGRWFSYLPLLAAVGGFFLLWAKRDSFLRPAFFALFYFLVALSPFLGFIYQSFWQYSFVEDHLQYLAGMGPLALLGAGLARFSAFVLPGPVLQRVAAAALLFLLGTLSWHQVWNYENEETLWSHTLAWNPGAWSGYNNLGEFFDQNGKVDEAIIQYQKAVEINPSDAVAYSNIGSALNQKGQVDEAIDQFNKALEINPNLALAHGNLGLVLDQNGRVDAAIEHYHKALEINPRYIQTYYNLGNALAEKGKLDEAIIEFKKALEINPRYADAYDNLGNILSREGRVNEAIDQYQKALEINSDSAAPHYNLGSALAHKGQIDEAIVQFQKALEINPDYAEAHNNLGIAFSQKGELEAAIAQFQEVVRLRPDDNHAQANLANARALLQQRTNPQ